MKRLFAIGLSLLMLVSSYAYSNLLDEFIKMEKVAYKGQTFPQIAVYFAKSGHKNSAILYLDTDKHLRIVVEAFLNGKWQKPKCGKIKDGLFVNHIGRPVDIISEPHRDLSIFCFWQCERFDAKAVQQVSVVGEGRVIRGEQLVADKYRAGASEKAQCLRLVAHLLTPGRQADDRSRHGDAGDCYGAHELEYIKLLRAVEWCACDLD